MAKFLVATGIVNIEVEANKPAHAIDVLKDRIRAREHEFFNPIIGMSLVEALKEGRLNFLVMNMDRTEAYAGEYQGRFQSRPTQALGESLRDAIPPALIEKLSPVEVPIEFDWDAALRDLTEFGC